MMIDKKRVRLSFSRAADRYDEAAFLQQEIADRLVERLTFFNLQPQAILDLGCGTGSHISQLMRHYPQARCYAVDFALPMLHHAKKQGYWLKRPICICGDMEALPLADQSVDLIYSNLAFQWATDIEQLFKECWRVLRPNGLLLATTFGPETLKELKQAWARVDDRPHTSEFIDIHDLGDALLRCGFAEPVLDIDRLSLYYQRIEDLMRELKQIGAHNARTEQNKGLTSKGQFQAMKQAYESFRTSQGLPASYEVIYMQAWRAEPVSIELSLPS